MKENRTEEGLLVRAEPLGLAKEISQRMVDVVRVEDGALLLEVDPKWAGAINTVLETKGVRVNEIRKETAAAARLIA
jgi:glutathione synthase/RimK-type ligase-like ATP-grasp enzyme